MRNTITSQRPRQHVTPCDDITQHITCVTSAGEQFAQQEAEKEKERKRDRGEMQRENERKMSREGHKRDPIAKTLS